MRQLIAPTEDFISTERTQLNAEAVAGSGVTLTLVNNNQLSQYDYIVIGIPGSEKAEIQQISDAVSGSTDVKVGALKFTHQPGEPVVKYSFNKRKFYGSLTKTGSYFELTANGSPADIQVDDPQGTILEYTGVEGYTYFKSTYYNSQTSVETDIADSQAIAGDQSDRYTTLYAIRVQAGITNNPFINDARIETKRMQAENEINSALYRLYTLPLTEVPPLVGRICELLAAGYIDFEEYGPDGQGVKWLGEARGILKSITEGRQNLIGEDGTELARKTLTQGIVSYPDQVDNNNGPQRKFTMLQRF